MTTDLNILEEMLDRATNPSRASVDELSLEMFCMVVRSNPQLVDKAQEMLITKIRSSDVTESCRAISLLEECMTKGGTEFQDEAAKFRFLNQLILLVSKKYQGAQTPTAIKQRIMDCLLLWTTEFTQRPKIREVYDMLHKEGGVEHGNTPAAVAKRESILGIDEDMLSKLIKSNDPENFKRANLLIQYRVSQAARRTELKLQHKSILQEVQNTVSLLNQMLDTYEADGQHEDRNGETVTLMRELYMACKKHKPILERLPELMENTEEALLVDTVEAIDLMQAVMKRYKNVVVHSTKTTPTAAATVPPSISSSASGEAATSKPTMYANLLSDLLGDAPTKTATPAAAPAVDFAGGDVELLDTVVVGTTATTKTSAAAGVGTLADLHEIFGDVGSTDAANSPSGGKNLNEIFSNLNLLEPISVFDTPPESSENVNETKVNGDTNVVDKCEFRGLPAIDKLSEELFKQSLPTKSRVGSFKKEPEKCTLNDLVKEKMQPKQTVTPTKATLGSRQPSGADPESAAAAKLDDDLVLCLDNEEPDNDKLATLTIAVSENAAPEAEAAPTAFPTKHLSEITVELDDVVPDTALAERVLMDDDDMKLTLSFTEDRPSRHVSVIVISAANRSKMPVRDFQFEASVRKPCKVRLLPPSASTMPPHKPFRPAVPINQVMLLLNPTGKAVDITCIVGYKLGDDPDAIKDSIVAKDIPFVE